MQRCLTQVADDDYFEPRPPATNGSSDQGVQIMVPAITADRSTSLEGEWRSGDRCRFSHVRQSANSGIPESRYACRSKSPPDVFARAATNDGPQIEGDVAGALKLFGQALESAKDTSFAEAKREASEAIRRLKSA